MRSALFVTTVGALALATAACGPAIDVRTTVAPDAGLANRHTFHILSTPPPRDGRTLSATDPMLNNSITNRELRQDIAQGLEKLGYAPVTDNADFNVAFYASTREKLDITLWDYDYLPWPRWYWSRWWGPEPVEQIQPYTEGTVLIDVFDPATKQLLWRGEGVSEVSDNPSKYSKNLEQTVTAIFKKFPRASGTVAQRT